MSVTISGPLTRGRRRFSPATLARHGILTLFSVVWLVPMYVMVVNAFKPEEAITGRPFSLAPDELTVSYLVAAFTSPELNVVRSYLATALLVVLNDVLTVVVCGPVAYLIARRAGRRWQLLLGYFLLGTFIPAQVVLIPTVSVLRGLGLAGTVAGLLLFQVVVHMPVTLFLYVGYIRGIPTSIDEAATLDGAGPLRIFWQLIFPLMRPVVATSVILVSMGVWNDFVSPQIILGPTSSFRTVTTGIYAAIGQYATDYTTVFPDLLLVIAPMIAFFLIMQRNIISGLTAGATKE